MKRAILVGWVLILALIVFCSMAILDYVYHSRNRTDGSGKLGVESVGAARQIETPVPEVSTPTPSATPEVKEEKLYEVSLGKFVRYSDKDEQIYFVDNNQKVSLVLGGEQNRSWFMTWITDAYVSPDQTKIVFRTVMPDVFEIFVYDLSKQETKKISLGTKDYSDQWQIVSWISNNELSLKLSENPNVENSVPKESLWIYNLTDDSVKSAVVQ